MNNKNNAFSFLAIGKTQESTDGGSFKRYVGLGSSYVLAVNPNKAELEKIYGREIAEEPVYVKDGENGKEVTVRFIVKTDPAVNNGIEVTNNLMFTLRNAAAYNKDKTKVQVIDDYGNYTWANAEDAKAGKKLLSSTGNPLKIDDKYRIACDGECDMVGFLKKLLRVQDVFNYVNGAWTKKDNPKDYEFKLEHIKDYFSGDFKELREALALQPNNKVKLLYGVRTNDEGKQYQVVASKDDLILHNNAGSNAIAKLETRLAEMKNNGSFATTEFKVCELQEWTVEATNLSTPAADTSSEMPWD